MHLVRITRVDKYLLLFLEPGVDGVESEESQSYKSACEMKCDRRVSTVLGTKPNDKLNLFWGL